MPEPNPIDTIREALVYPIDVPVALAALNLLDEHFAAETGKSYDQGFASGIKENARRREAAETALAEATAENKRLRKRTPILAEARAEAAEQRANALVDALRDALDFTNCKGLCGDAGCPFCGGTLIAARAALDRHTPGAVT